MEILIKIGRDKGLREIYGEVLEDNEKMLDFAQVSALRRDSPSTAQ